MPRMLFVDVARGFAILLVIFGHSLEAVMTRPAVGNSLFLIWKGIYSFHVPLFFVLAGFVSRPRTFPEELKRSLGLVMAGALAEFPAFWIEQLLGRDTQLILHFRNFAGLYQTTPYHQGLIVTWFLSSLALVQMLDHGMRQSSRRLRLIGLALILISFIAHQMTQLNLLQLGSLLPGWICLVFGRRLRGFQRPLMHLKTWLLPSLFALSALTIGIIIDQWNQGCLINPLMVCPNMGHRFAVFLITGDVGFPLLFLLSAFASSLAVLTFSGLIAHHWRALSQVIGRIGRNSLILLLANGYFLSLFELPYLKPLETLSSITPMEGIILSSLIVLLHLLALPVLAPALNGLLMLGQGLSNCLVDGLIRLKSPFSRRDITP